MEETVAVHYVPPVTGDVMLTRPLDGHRLGPDDPPLVAVEGRVDDVSVTTVSIVTNGRRVQVPVTAGRFRHVVPVLDQVVHIRAETSIDGRGSETVTVRAKQPINSAPCQFLRLQLPPLSVRKCPHPRGGTLPYGDKT